MPNTIFEDLTFRKYDDFHLVQATRLDRDLKTFYLWYNQRFLKQNENQPNQLQISKSGSILVLTLDMIIWLGMYITSVQQPVFSLTL